MITNVQSAGTLGDIQRYVRYTIAPEKDQTHPEYKHGERTLGVESDNIDMDFELDRNKSSHKVANQITEWNREHRQGNARPSKPALFGNISFSPEDTKQFMCTSTQGIKKYLDVKKVLAVARQAVVNTMGSNRPIYLCAHGDTEHLHVHFVVGLVNDQGQIWNGTKGEKTFRTWEKTNEGLEIEHGLKRVQHRKAFIKEGEHREAPLERLRNSEIHLANKGELSLLADLQGRLEESHKAANGNFGKFLDEVKAHGIRISPNMSSTKVDGLSFSLDNEPYIKGSAVGSKYKWSKLAKGLNYDSERDYSKLAELKERENARKAELSIRTLLGNDYSTNNNDEQSNELVRNTIEGNGYDKQSNAFTDQSVGNNDCTDEHNVRANKDIEQSEADEYESTSTGNKQLVGKYNEGQKPESFSVNGHQSEIGSTSRQDTIDGTYNNNETRPNGHEVLNVAERVNSRLDSSQQGNISSNERKEENNSVGGRVGSGERDSNGHILLPSMQRNTASMGGSKDSLANSNNNASPTSSTTATNTATSTANATSQETKVMTFKDFLNSTYEENRVVAKHFSKLGYSDNETNKLLEKLADDYYKKADTEYDNVNLLDLKSKDEVDNYKNCMLLNRKDAVLFMTEGELEDVREDVSAYAASKSLNEAVEQDAQPNNKKRTNTINIEQW